MRNGPQWTVIPMILLAAMAWGQNVEVTGLLGGQKNGGIDLSTTLFNRFEVQNGKNYGLAVGYLLGDRFGAEFSWTYNKADALARPISTGPEVQVFTMDTNQYFGNVQYHFASRSKPFRPFIMAGVGEVSFRPARQGINASDRFAWDVGGGVKADAREGLRWLRRAARRGDPVLRQARSPPWCAAGVPA